MMRPVVHLSYAQSIDGRIATRSGDSRYISSKATLELAHQIRSENDAILVGIGTVLQDDPRLNCRLPGGCTQQPLRVIIDSKLRIPLNSVIAQTSAEQATLVIHGPVPNAANATLFNESIAALHSLGIQTRQVERDQAGRLHLDQIMATLANSGISSVFVEGGSGILTSFIRQGMVDLLTVIIAPMLIGDGIQAVGDLGITQLQQVMRFETVWMKQIGPDIAWRLRPVISA